MADESGISIKVSLDAAGVPATLEQMTARLDALEASLGNVSGASGHASESVSEHGEAHEKTGEKVGKTSEATEALIGKLGVLSGATGLASEGFEKLGIEVGGAAGNINLAKEAIEAFSATAPLMLALGGIVAAESAGFLLLKDAIEDASRAQLVFVSVSALVRNQGEGWQENTAAIREYSEALSQGGITSHREILAAMQQMLVAGVSVNDMLRSQQAAADLAVAKNESLGEAEQQLAMAYDGRMREMERLGLVTKEEVAAGVPYEELLSRIEERMGGSAAAALGTYSGKQENLTNLINAQKGAIGSALLPAMSDWEDMLRQIAIAAEPMTEQFVAWINSQMPALRDGFAAWGRVIGDIVANVLPTFISMMENALDAFARLGNWFGDHESTISDFFYTVLGAGAVGALSSIIPLLGGVVDGLWSVIAVIGGTETALDALAVSEAAATLGMSLVVTGIVLGVADLLKNWGDYARTAEDFWDGITSGVKAMGDGIKSVFDSIGLTLDNAFTAWDTSLANFLDKIPGASAIANGIRSSAQGLQTDAVTIQGRQPGGSAFSSSVTQWDQYTNAAAAQTGVDPNLIRAVMQAESGGINGQTSRTGAQGLMQLEPGTAAGLGVTNLQDAAQSIKGGAQYLADLLKEFHGNTTLAIAAYNAGPGAVEKYGGVPPFAETKAYVQNVDKYLAGTTRTSAANALGGNAAPLGGAAASWGGGWGPTDTGGHIGDTASWGTFTGGPETTKSKRIIPGGTTGAGGSSFTPVEYEPDKVDAYAAAQKALDDQLKHVDDSEKVLETSVRLATTAQGEQSAQAALDAQKIVDLETKHRLLSDSMAAETTQIATLQAAQVQSANAQTAAIAAYDQYGLAHKDGSKMTADETNRLAELKTKMDDAVKGGKELSDTVKALTDNLQKNRSALNDVDVGLASFATKNAEAVAVADRAWESYKSKTAETMADDLATTSTTQSQKATYYADSLTKLESLDAEYHTKFASAQAELAAAQASGNKDRIESAAQTASALSALIVKTEKDEETTDAKRVQAYIQSINAMSNAQKSWIDFQSSESTKMTNAFSTEGMSEAQKYHYFAGLYQDDYALWQQYQNEKNVDLATRLLPKMESDVSSANAALLALYQQDAANAKAAHDAQVKDVDDFISAIVVSHKSLADELRSIYSDVEKSFLSMISKMLVDSKGFQNLFGGLGGGGAASAGTGGSGAAAGGGGGLLSGLTGLLGGGGSGSAPNGTAGNPVNVQLAGASAGLLGQLTGQNAGVSSSGVTTFYNSSLSSNLVSSLTNPTSGASASSNLPGESWFSGNQATGVPSGSSSSNLSLSGALTGAALGGAFSQLLAGLFGSGQNDSSLGGALGGAVGSIGGPIGSAIGGGLGSLIGGLFGNHWTAAQQPDKSNPQVGGIDYRTFTSNMGGAAGQFDGQWVSPQAQYNTGLAGGVSERVQLFNLISQVLSKNSGAGSQQTSEAQALKALERGDTNPQTALNIVSEKQGVYTLGSGATIGVTQFMSMVQQFMTDAGSLKAAIPTFNLARPYGNPNLSSLTPEGTQPANGVVIASNTAGLAAVTGGSQAAYATSGGSRHTSEVHVVVQGNVVGSSGIRELAQVVSENLYAAQRGSAPASGRQNALSRNGGGW